MNQSASSAFKAVVVKRSHSPASEETPSPHLRRHTFDASTTTAPPPPLAQQQQQLYGDPWWTRLLKDTLKEVKVQEQRESEEKKQSNSGSLRITTTTSSTSLSANSLPSQPNYKQYSTPLSQFTRGSCCSSLGPSAPKRVCLQPRRPRLWVKRESPLPDEIEAASVHSLLSQSQSTSANLNHPQVKEESRRHSVEDENEVDFEGNSNSNNSSSEASSEVSQSSQTSDEADLELIRALLPLGEQIEASSIGDRHRAGLHYRFLRQRPEGHLEGDHIPPTTPLATRSVHSIARNNILYNNATNNADNLNSD